MADKGEKSVWDDANVVHFITICKEDISNGNRPLGFFSSTGWKNFVEKFEAKIGKKLTKLQLKNKWVNIKKECTWFCMTPDVFTTLHDLLVSTYRLKSTNNVSSIESLAIFL
jgi:hypothetical protein